MARARKKHSRHSLKHPPAPIAQGIRLQKVLSELGLASRREAEEWIRAGRLSVNGKPATLGVRVSGEDKLQLDGRPIRQRLHADGGTQTSSVFLCHRSPGESLLTARPGDDATQPDSALVERIPRRSGRRFIAISPMPRIDGGLELVTSDGSVAMRLQRAAHGMNSEFTVRIRGELFEAAQRGVLEGVLDRGARLAVQSCEPSGGEGANRWYTVVARGGSGKDLRQLFERQGVLVSRVLRVRLGPVVLDRLLGRGQFRELETTEIDSLLTGTDQRDGDAEEPTAARD